jgi:hypothetical protein
MQLNSTCTDNRHLLINQPARLERELNYTIMGGSNFYCVEKLKAVCCSSVGFLVTQDGVRPSKKEYVSRQKIKWRE